MPQKRLEFGYSPDLLLPTGKGQPAKLARLAIGQGGLQVVAPVCPPTLSRGSNYRPAITPEASAAVRAAHVLVEDFGPTIGVPTEVTILIADTEEDLPMVVNGMGTERYRQVCADSAGMLASAAPSGVRVSTFSEAFGGEFYTLQSANETQVRELASSDSKLTATLARLSAGRLAKHAAILGRPEEGNELAVRYAGQYLTLGQTIRDASGPFNAALNYQTDNIQYYNHPLAGSGAVPVFESRRRPE